MHHRRIMAWTGAVGIASAWMLAAGGCMLGPDPARPASVADASDRFAHADAPADPNAAPPEMTEWWSSFDDPHIDRLIDRAMQHNTDLHVAAARAMEAQALLGVALGQRLPSLDISGARDRRQNTFAFEGPRFTSRSTTWTAQGTVAWQADLFGRLRRGQQRAEFDLQSSLANRQAVIHSVVASIVRTRARLAIAQRQLELAYETVESFERTREITEQRYEAGVTTAVELRLARENLAGARARIPELEFLVAQARHALDVLVGRQPGTGGPIADTLAELPPLDAPPAGLPAWLLDRRPDLRSTQLAAMAQQAGIGQAIADMLPDLTIAASGGYQGSDFEDVYPAPDTLIWSLATELSMKVFRGGALRANVEAAEARAQAAAAEYAGAVLTAMREVEDALVRESTARRRYAQLKEQVAEALAAEDLAREQYEAGVTNLLIVLEVERRRRDAQDRLYATQQVLWDARVNLYLALGGDWIAQPPELRTSPPAQEVQEP